MSHYLESWRPHSFDNQTTVYRCHCGFESSNRHTLQSHIERRTQ